MFVNCRQARFLSGSYNSIFGKIIYIFIRQKGSSNKWKKHQTHNKNKQTKERKKNYAQIGQASEQCYHQRTLKNVC